MQPNEQRSKALERTARKAQVVQRVLSTKDGQELMKFLIEQFLYPAESESPHGPAFRLGQNDVIGYLMQLRNFRETA
jgi:hypothetical protein